MSSATTTTPPPSTEKDKKSEEKVYSFTEDASLDMLAAALVSQCKLIHREYIKLRHITGANQEKFHSLNRQLYECFEDFSQRYGAERWLTARTEKGETYYVDALSGKTQWERPYIFEKFIDRAKKGIDAEYTEPWQECELLHVKLFQCEHSKELQARKQQCGLENERFLRCLKQKLSHGRVKMD